MWQTKQQLSSIGELLGKKTLGEWKDTHLSAHRTLAVVVVAAAVKVLVVVVVAAAAAHLRAATAAATGHVPQRRRC